MSRQYPDERERNRGHNGDGCLEGLKPSHHKDVNQDEDGGKRQSEITEDLVRDVPFPVPLYGVLLGREGLVGDIPHIDELAEPQIVKREDGSWLVDGTLPVDDFRETVDPEGLPEEEEDQYTTLGGFVMMHLEKIPTTGDHFEWGGYRFEVVDMDERRVDKILVSPLAKDNRNG